MVYSIIYKIYFDKDTRQQGERTDLWRKWNAEQRFAFHERETNDCLCQAAKSPHSFHTIPLRLCALARRVVQQTSRARTKTHRRSYYIYDTKFFPSFLNVTLR